MVNVLNFHSLAEKYLRAYEIAKNNLNARTSRKKIRSYLSSGKVLTQEQKNQVVAFWTPYAKITSDFHAFYLEKTGTFAPEFIPTDLYYTKIDPFFNPARMSSVMDNKCLYSRLFPGIPQPQTVLFRMNNYWYDSNREKVTWQRAQAIMEAEKELFVKAATGSCSGQGVFYFSAENGNLAEQFTKQVRIAGDIVVQRPVVQHQVFAKMNASSVNTFRILSLLTDEGVKCYSTLVRIGVANRKVDNRGLSCGVQPDGKLNARAYRLNGESFTKHPDHDFTFEGYQLIGLDKAKALIEKAHPMIPYFRMISWDIAIDEQGEPVMLEANFSKGCLDFLQLNNGPLFGDDTKKILDEVFGKTKLR